MNDRQIIELYLERKEAAIQATQEAYGRYCYTIAYGILSDHQDAEECVNDTYVSLWNAIPPHEPEYFKGFIGKLTRNNAIKIYERKTADKRGGNRTSLVLDEFGECLPDSENGNPADDAALKDMLERFLYTLPVKHRRIFLQRYWYAAELGTIAATLGINIDHVKVILFRTRKKLKDFLEKEGIQV